MSEIHVRAGPPHFYRTGPDRVLIRPWLQSLMNSAASRGGLGRLTAWHLPGGPVGPVSRWAATSNVKVGQTTYPLTGEG